MRNFAFAVAMIMALLQTHHAWAHAVPLEYSPESASVSAHAPENVEIRFSERIDPSASSISVYGPDGAEIDDGKSVVDAADAHRFSAGMRAAGSGTYTVSWQVVSADDGHFTKGGFIFSVGQASKAASAAQGQFQVQHRSDWPDAITICLELLGSAILIGVLACIAALWRLLKKGIGMEARNVLRRRLLLLIGIGGLLTVAGGILYLWLESANLAFDQSIAFHRAFHLFLFTVAGRYTIYRLVLGIVLSCLLAFSLSTILRADRITKREIFFFMLIGLIDLLRARVSHAAASSFLPTFSIAVNAVHLALKDLWIGGLVVFATAFLPMLDRERRATRTASVLLSFSYLPIASLAMGGVSGVYIVWLHLKSFDNIATTHWGVYFLGLFGFAAMLLLLRLFQQKVVNPALLRACEGNKENDPLATVQMAGPLLVTEMFVGLGVLLFSSILIITTPPLISPHYYAQTVSTPNATITLGEHHDETDQFLVTVARNGAMQTGSGESMTVTLENREKNIGPLVAKTEERFPGGFVFAKDNLSSPGTWTVKVTEHLPHQFDANALFTLDYPADILAVHRYDETRRFGWFEAVMVLAAACILAGAFWLYRDNARLLRRLRDASRKPLSIPPLIRKPWLTTLISLAVVLFLGASVGHNHGGSDMARQCALLGGQWHENVPMRDGRATSDIAALGCMLGAGEGTFHFVDPREFAYFTRPTFAYATLKIDPAPVQPGTPATLWFHIQDSSGQPVPRLTLEHDRILHVIIISRDFRTFAHVHVEDTQPVTQQMRSAATFPVQYTFPAAGRYLVAADYTIGAKTSNDTFMVDVGGKTPPQSPITDRASEKTFDGMRVTLAAPSPLKAGTFQRISYMFTQSGKSVTDLQPYLSAAMHLSIVSSDLHTFIHTHAELPQTFLEALFNPRDPTLTHYHVFLPDRFGPTLVAYVFFPLPGRYELFGEVNRGGRIVLTKFTVQVQ